LPDEKYPPLKKEQLCCNTELILATLDFLFIFMCLNEHHPFKLDIITYINCNSFNDLRIMPKINLRYIKENNRPKMRRIFGARQGNKFCS